MMIVVLNVAALVLVRTNLASARILSADVGVNVSVPDVVVVLEQILANSELFKDLVTPLVTTLTSELKLKP